MAGSPRVRPSRQPLRGFLRMTFFVNAIKNSRHPEERPKGASRRTQNIDAVVLREGARCSSPATARSRQPSPGRPISSSRSAGAPRSLGSRSNRSVIARAGGKIAPRGPLRRLCADSGHSLPISRDWPATSAANGWSTVGRRGYCRMPTATTAQPPPLVGISTSRDPALVSTTGSARSMAIVWPSLISSACIALHDRATG
jgi:hypothetical protein